MDITILFSDSELVVVNKPGGLLSVPGRGPEKLDSVATRLRTTFKEMIEQPSVHRLDMYTSGLMVFAMTKESHRHLSNQFATRKVNKTYYAILEKKLEAEGGEIRLAFRLDPDNRPYQVYDPEQGKIGISSWKKLLTSPTTTTIEFTPLTGRTHQLRLHAAHPLGLNAPIVGDSLYGSGNDGDQMLLHANQLEFHHPTTGTKMSFTSPPPFEVPLFP
ncbi:MAG: RNA pseudouridine synthase [Desulfotalea sp.]|nr:MAG: RNA pseudouridine synthase [Desulfotalea sp.]